MSSVRIRPTAIVDRHAEIGNPGSARVSRAGFGIAPKQSFVVRYLVSKHFANKSPRPRARVRQHARRLRYRDCDRALEHVKPATVAIDTSSQQ